LTADRIAGRLHPFRHVGRKVLRAGGTVCGGDRGTRQRARSNPSDRKPAISQKEPARHRGFGLALLLAPPIVVRSPLVRLAHCRFLTIKDVRRCIATGRAFTGSIPAKAPIGKSGH
jgi:hypothetical protein